MPGVQTVTDTYSNGVTAGVAYNVQITMADSATEEQAAAVTEQYYQATRQGFDKHSQRLTMRAGDDAFAHFSKAPTDPAPQVAAVRRWWQLREQIPAALDWSNTSIRPGLTRAVQVTADAPADELLKALRDNTSDLPDTQWIVRTGKTRIDLFGGYPAPSETALIARLTGTGQWSISFDPASNPATAPALQLSVWEFDPAALESTARAHLQLISRLDEPVTYTLKPSGGEPIVVAVHGCRQGGSALQQRLNADFGSC